MGYYMSQKDADFTILKENKIKALELLKELADENRDLAWVNSDVIIESKTIEDALNECGYVIEEDDCGNVVAIYFNREKLGDEALIFNAIAPTVKNDSYIEMAGEDACIWRWVFNKGKCMKKQAKISWE